MTQQKKPTTVDAYIAQATPLQRTALERVRRAIRSAAPKAEECISYGLAAFRFEGRMLVAFGAWANHCALYPMSSATVKKFGSQLKNFETTKGTIRFTPDYPLPVSLIRKLVKARIAENRARSKVTQ